jgi:toxin ParE1/3/4
MKVQWLPAAKDGLFAIGDNIAATNPLSAMQLEIRVDEAIGHLAELPLTGTAGRTPGTRELVVPRTPCVVIYQLDSAKDEVHILRIIDTRADGVRGTQHEEE